MSTFGGRWSWPALVGVVALVSGAISGWRLLEHVGLGLLGLLAICLVATLLSAALLSAEGSAATRTLTAGDRLTIRYEIRNRGFWPLIWPLLRPQGFSSLPVEGQMIALRPRGRRRVDVSLSCPQRGHWQAGGWTLHVGDPFGFFERIRIGAGLDSVTVYPRPILLPDLALPAPLGRGNSPRGLHSRQPSAMVREVRPYRPGDLPSRVHWLSTARLDTLMVKEPEGEPAAHAWLVLDLDAAVQYGEEEGDSVELIVGAACYLVERHLRARIATGLLVVGPGHAIYPDFRHGQADRMLDILATVEPESGSVEQVLGLVRTRASYGPVGRLGSVIVVTPWADARWTAHLPALARAGYSVVCIILDTPESERGPELQAQAGALHAAGVRVYRHTTWVP